MKFLYLIPLVLPQVASACIGSTTQGMLGLLIAGIVPVVFVAALINIVLLLTIRFLPSNKGLSIVQVLQRAKKPMIVVTVAVAVATISFFYVAYSTTYACL